MVAWMNSGEKIDCGNAVLDEGLGISTRIIEFAPGLIERMVQSQLQITAIGPLDQRVQTRAEDAGANDEHFVGFGEYRARIRWSCRAANHIDVEVRYDVPRRQNSTVDEFLRAEQTDLVAGVPNEHDRPPRMRCAHHLLRDC